MIIHRLFMGTPITRCEVSVASHKTPLIFGGSVYPITPPENNDRLGAPPCKVGHLVLGPRRDGCFVVGSKSRGLLRIGKLIRAVRMVTMTSAMADHRFFNQYGQGTTWMSRWKLTNG